MKPFDQYEEGFNDAIKCENHKLHLACIGCVRVRVMQRKKLLEFVKTIVKDWECDPNHAEQLLKEIGEI